MIIALLTLLAMAVRLNWTVAGCMLAWFGKRYNLPIFRWLYFELRPFYLPAALYGIGELTIAGEMTGWNIFYSACSLANWWFLKDVDKDDRWKRRKAKVVEKIQRRGARLVAVPAGGVR